MITAIAGMALFLAPLVSSRPALAQFKQQGHKLVGTGAVGAANQGNSVALSADGNTAIVGGLSDNSNAGAVWVFTRSNGVWSQQGNKLVGNGATGAANQGSSVALSADGNTVAVGGPSEPSNFGGAVWVFTRDNNGAWSQQDKLFCIGVCVGPEELGFSVALSADGNTSIAGGPGDNSNVGAALVFTRSNGVWSQQHKLIGTGAVGGAQQGHRVALSADGNTAIVGGNSDNSNAGAVWVFTRSHGVWSQQGNKLVGPGAAGAARQGQSVALSANGNTAMIGGPGDNSNVGAVWVFTRSHGVWSQQGQKLIGTGAVGAAEQGNSVSLSADGNTAVIGGPGDNSNAGAVWVFTRSNGVWTQQGKKLVGTGAVGGVVSQGFVVSLSADGHTAITGGSGDNSSTGAVWVFVAAPVVTSVRPNEGPETGGTAVTIQGKNFTGATAVKFGATAATSFKVTSSNTIVAHTPKRPAGIVAVTATTPAGTGAKARAFTFAAPPTVATVSPSLGPAAGGTTVTIRGKSLTGAIQIKFGASAATSFKVTNSTTIVAHTPKHRAGKVALTVRTAGGITQKLDAFTYQ